MRRERRRFNRGERAALSLAADGRCSLCGVELTAGWHADHVAAYSQGGSTDVMNGQALCPNCNLRKGARALGAETGGWTIPLREWQQEAHNAYLQSDGDDALCVATPGAGKTIYALYVGWSLYTAGVVSRMVIVAPTDHLRAQWVQAASKVGIELQGDFQKDNREEATDYSGLVTTYQAVAQAPEVYRAQCRRRTLVILDEPHHMNGHSGWGAAVQRAFEPAVKRLSITGTPFRSDNAAIPFVRYEDGRCVADYSYDYGRALQDGVCRPVYFPSYEGRMTWWTNTHGERTATFDEELPPEEDGRRLNTAIDPAGEWLGGVIRDANARLTDIRESIYADAAGLIITRDQVHARDTARLVRRITGEEPAIAISEDPNASKVIEAFARGRGRWIVAVRMVSEGVDIPRLFVGVYATNILTELYFRQVVGRFVRVLPGIDDQTGWLFIPRVDRLIEYVQEIKGQRDHVLAADDEDEDAGDTGQARSPCDAPRAGSVFTPLGSEGVASDVWFDGERFQQSEIAEARVILQELGVAQRNEVLTALIMRRVRARDAREGTSHDAPRSSSAADDGAPLDRQKERARLKIRSLVNRYVAITGQPYSHVHNELNILTGGKIAQATLAQLEERIHLITDWLEAADG